MRVRDVMTPGTAYAAPNATLREVSRQMGDLLTPVLPVCGTGDRLLGLVTERDVADRVAAGLDPDRTPVTAAMTPGTASCFEDDDAGLVADFLRAGGHLRLVVLSRQNRLVGLVAADQLSR